MSARHLFAYLLAVVACLGGPVRADDAWVLTTGDFVERRVVVRAMDAAQLTIADTTGGPSRQVPLADVLELARASAIAPVAPGPFTLYLANGNRLTGRAVAMTEEALTWNNPLLGERSIPLHDLRAVARKDRAPERIDQPRTEDALVLHNGDAVRGIIAAIDGAGITINREGAPVPVPWDAVAAVYFVSTGGAEPAAEFRARLSDGSIVPADAVVIDHASVRLTIGAAGKASVALAALVGIEHINGPIRWLSSLIPVESVQIPYFPGARTVPARMDQSVTGEPIRVAGRTFGHGIGVHAYSRLVYELDGAFAAFRTRYALEAGPYANVSVRIKLDDQIVYEKEDSAPGELSPVVEFPLAGAKRLTLEVDYGQTLDVQDRFVWIQPALLRSSEAAPSSAPLAPAR